MGTDKRRVGGKERRKAGKVRIWKYGGRTERKISTPPANSRLLFNITS